MTLADKLMKFSLSVGTFMGQGEWWCCQAISDYDLCVPNRGYYATGATPEEAVDACIRLMEATK